MNSRPSGVTRRSVLTGVAVASGTVAGCSGLAGRINPSRTSDGGGDPATVSVLAAGSLQNALENGLIPAADVPVQIETHGSTTVARLIAEGKRDPDIVSVADTALFDQPLSPSWYSVFTSNAVVIAYNPNTKGGQRLADAGAANWYKPVVNGNVDIGRTDPDQDPLGYRALFMLELASRYYDDAPNLTQNILKRNQIYPETALISQFETGSIDAAIAYRNMATERGYKYIDLPDQIDLSDPRYAKEWYSTVSYTLPSGMNIRGGLISYGSTVRHMNDAVLTVFSVHTTGDYLKEHGFILRKQVPIYKGTVPERVTQATGPSRSSRSLASGHGSELGATTSDTTALI